MSVRALYTACCAGNPDEVKDLATAVILLRKKGHTLICDTNVWVGGKFHPDMIYNAINSAHNAKMDTPFLYCSVISAM